MRSRFAIYFSMLLAVVTAACGSSTGDTYLPGFVVSQITITDSTIPFDDKLVTFGTLSSAPATTSATVTITNSGADGLEILRIGSLDPATPPFSIINDPCTGHTLGSFGQCTLTIGLDLSKPGAFSDTFEIQSTDPVSRSIKVGMSAQVI